MFKKVSGWFKQPPALLLRSSLNGFPSSTPFSAEEEDVAFQEPKNCVSFQVFDKENIEVLIKRQIDNSLKCVKKSSKGILKYNLRDLKFYTNWYHLMIGLPMSLIDFIQSPYQNSPSSLKVSPSFSRCFSEIFAHSGDLERRRVNEEQEYKYAWVMLSRSTLLLAEFPLLPLPFLPMTPLDTSEEADWIGSLALQKQENRK